MYQIRSNMNLGVLRQRKEAKIWIVLQVKTMNLVWSQIRNDEEKGLCRERPKGYICAGGMKTQSQASKTGKVG